MTSTQHLQCRKVIAEVTADGRNFWSAHDQGRLAFHSGEAFKDNPHRLPTPGYFHVNMADWERGWKQEADAACGAASA